MNTKFYSGLQKAICRYLCHPETCEALLYEGGTAGRLGIRNQKQLSTLVGLITVCLLTTGFFKHFTHSFKHTLFTYHPDLTYINIWPYLLQILFVFSPFYCLKKWASVLLFFLILYEIRSETWNLLGIQTSKPQFLL